MYVCAQSTYLFHFEMLVSSLKQQSFEKVILIVSMSHFDLYRYHPHAFENVLKSKQKIHIISFQPISRRSSANSFHELSINSVSIDVIGEFWQATKREFVGIVWIVTAQNQLTQRSIKHSEEMFLRILLFRLFKWER